MEEALAAKFRHLQKVKQAIEAAEKAKQQVKPDNQEHLPHLLEAIQTAKTHYAVLQTQYTDLKRKVNAQKRQNVPAVNTPKSGSNIRPAGIQQPTKPKRTKPAKVRPEHVKALQERNTLSEANAITRLRALKKHEKTEKEAKREFWGYDFLKPELPKVYFAFIDNKYEKILETFYREANGNTRLALKLQQQGWLPDRSKFRVLDGDTNTLKSLSKNTVEAKMRNAGVSALRAAQLILQNKKKAANSKNKISAEKLQKLEANGKYYSPSLKKIFESRKVIETVRREGKFDSLENAAKFKVYWDSTMAKKTNNNKKTNQWATTTDGKKVVLYKWDFGKQRYDRIYKSTYNSITDDKLKEIANDTKKREEKKLLARRLQRQLNKEGWSKNKSEYKIYNNATNQLRTLSKSTILKIRHENPTLKSHQAAKKYLQNVRAAEERQRLQNLQKKEENRLKREQNKKEKEEKRQHNREQKEREKAEAASKRLEEKGKYKSKDGKLYDIEKLEVIKKKANLPNTNWQEKAASLFNYYKKHFKSLKNSATNPDKQSGWTYDINKKNVPQVFVYWRTKADSPTILTLEDMEKSGHYPQKALLLKRAGWNKAGERYGVIVQNKTSNEEMVKYARKANMNIVKNRIHSFWGRRVTDDEAALALVEKSQRNDGGGYYNFQRNAYVYGPGGNNIIPGAVFTPLYLKRKAKLVPNVRHPDTESSNNNVNQTSMYPRNNLAENVAATHLKNKAMSTAKAFQPSRERLDEQFLKDIPPVVSPDFKVWLKRIMKVNSSPGSLQGRPLVTGNVGIPGDPRDPVEQVEEDTTGDGCKYLAKRWPDQQGKSIMLHQSVVYLMANLKARNYIHTPGFLVLHSVGSGKTLSGLSCIIAFWNSNKAIIPVSVRSNQNGNDLDKLAVLASEYFPWFRSTLKAEPPYNTKIRFEEYPFASGKQKALEQIQLRLRVGHYHLGNKDPGSLSESQLLATPTTLINKLFGHFTVPEEEKEKEHPKILWKKAKKSESYYDLEGFFAAKGKKKTNLLKNCVFIIDEIQLFLSPPPTELAFKHHYRILNDVLMHRRDPESTWVLGMTATVGETLEQVQGVLSVIAGKDVTPQNLKESIKGLISFVYTQGDRSRYGAVDVQHHCLPLKAFTDPQYAEYPILYLQNLLKLAETHEAARGCYTSERKVQVKEAPRQYSEYQFESKFTYLKRVRERTQYLEVTKSTNTNTSNWNLNNNSNNNNTPEKLKNDGAMNFLAEGDDVYQRIKLLGEKSAQSAVIRACKRNCHEDTNRRARGGASDEDPKEFYYIVSPKIAGVLEEIETKPGIHYVYCYDIKTLRLIAFLLESRYGYEYMTGNRAQESAKAKYITTKRKRFCFTDAQTSAPETKLWDPKLQKWKHQPKIFADNKLKSFVLHNEANKYGEVCKVILASKLSYKGVDYKYIRHVHCISMLPDLIDLIQLVGRGPRFCGHRGLKFSEWKITFHTWRLVSGGLECSGPAAKLLFPDEQYLERATKAYESGYGSVEKHLMEAAVDSTLFATYNKESQELLKSLRFLCKASNRANKDYRIPKFNFSLTPKKKAAEPARNRKPVTKQELLLKRLRAYERLVKEGKIAANTQALQQLREKLGKR